jgi:hypothetical protein
MGLADRIAEGSEQGAHANCSGYGAAESIGSNTTGV